MKGYIKDVVAYREWELLVKAIIVERGESWLFIIQKDLLWNYLLKKKKGRANNLFTM